MTYSKIGMPSLKAICPTADSARLDRLEKLRETN